MNLNPMDTTSESTGYLVSESPGALRLNLQ